MLDKFHYTHNHYKSHLESLVGAFTVTVTGLIQGENEPASRAEVEIPRVRKDRLFICPEMNWKLWLANL